MSHRFSIVLCVCCVVGCTQSTPSNLDPDRLLQLADDEAGQIAAPKERLTRQLNIANYQIHAGRADSARNTLRQAKETLDHADAQALTDRERLAGWVSLCELSREAKDAGFAGTALDQALAALEQVTPHQARCPYVLGVEREVRALRGDAAAIKLLTTAADWAVEIEAVPTRPSAYLAFAEELFRCNDYDA